MKKLFTNLIFAAVLLAAAASVGEGQTRKRRPAVKKPSPAASEVASSSAVAEPTTAPPKRNERPDSPDSAGQRPAPPSEKRGAPGVIPAFEYEFSQPEFVISNIKIQHGEDGAGTISFRKKGSDELITDPISLSPKALSRINDVLNSLNFLDSTENYQYEKDFSHLGTIKFSLRRKGRSRDVTYNWSENKDAKNLMNEYRRISNQFIWIFDISLSRENQPLEAPKLMDSLDSMIRRNEISDPHQLDPFLRELSDDERIPLIARNHAARLVKQFEKEKAKEEKKKSEGSE